MADGLTALHAAAEAGRLEEVQQLLAASRAHVNARNTQGSTPLHLAACADHGAIVAALLKAGADRHARDSRGRTALHVAATYGSHDTMQQLMASGASCHAYDKRGNQPLHLACSHGRAEAARLLLAGGAPVNQCRAGKATGQGLKKSHRSPSDNYTPLHAACERSEVEVEVVRVLLSAGAKVNLRCHKGCTPLWLASKRGCVHVMEELLSRGANSMALDKQGRAPLHIACQNNRTGTVQRLLDIPEVLAAVNKPTAAGATPLILAIRGGCGPVVSLLGAAGAIMDRKGDHGESFLQTAVRQNQVDMVERLLAAGADPGDADEDGYNTLHAAAAAGSHLVLQKLAAAVAAGQGTAGLDAVVKGQTALHLSLEGHHWECVEVLVAAGADASKVYGVGAWRVGASPLHRAVQLGGEAVVPLLATPANLRHLWKGQTPLHMALAPEQGQERVVSMAGVLLAAGAPPGLPNVHGVTPLQLAAKTGCGPVVSLLVAAGASIRCRAADGDTVLHTAVGSNQLDVVKRLLAAGADPGAASASGHNSLHAAAAAGHCRILQALLAAVAAGQGTAGLGAEVLGMTALHLAVEHQHWECVEVLVAAGADPHQLYGAGAGQLHRASALHRAVQLGGEAVVPLLATPTSLRYLWKGQTPLHMALAPEQDLQLQVTMVHALLAAGASPGQPNQHGVTPLQLAARSSRVTTMGLAADIVRSECVLYQQRQQTQQLRTKERALNALLARVADAVCDLLGGTYLPACMSCITAVMEVLGVEAGSALVSQLLEGEFAMHIDSGAEVGMQLANMLYRSWLAVVQPHTHKQGQVISRLQALVLQPQQQRLQEQQFGAHHQEPLRATSAAAGKQAGQAPGAAAQLHAKGVAAVHAGQWHALMQCLEQLMAVHPSHEGDDAAALLEVAVGMCSHSWPQLARLSDVLLAAWWEAQHATAARVSPEVVEAVVAVVQAWQQLQGQSAPMGANSRRRLG